MMNADKRWFKSRNSKNAFIFWAEESFPVFLLIRVRSLPLMTKLYFELMKTAISIPL